MFSRGALNGSEMNAQPVNGGSIVLDVAAADAIVLAHSAPLVRKAFASANDAVSLGSSATLVRRALPAAATAIVFNHDATLVRRALTESTASIELNGSGTLFWRFRQAAPHSRTAALHADRRSTQIPGDRRRVDVPAQTDADISSGRRSVA